MKREKIKFEFDKNNLKAFIRAMCIVMMFAFLGALIVSLLIPLLTGIIRWFVHIWELYLLIDNINYKFFGAIFFLYIGWRIFDALAIVFLELGKVTICKMRILFRGLKREKTK